jgi:hypothetical protein
MTITKEYLKLALVSCPIALYAACSTAERIAFRQINKATGNRLRQQLIDEETCATPRDYFADLPELAMVGLATGSSSASPLPKPRSEAGPIALADALAGLSPSRLFTNPPPISMTELDDGRACGKVEPRSGGPLRR